MKRQGTYGFTFDSKAEEWGYWAASCLEHNSPETWKGRRDLARFANDMLDIHDGIATEARHSPAQQQNGCEIGEGSGRGLLTPVGRLNLVLIATNIGTAIALWFWGYY